MSHERTPQKGKPPKVILQGKCNARQRARLRCEILLSRRRLVTLLAAPRDIYKSTVTWRVRRCLCGYGPSCQVSTVDGWRKIAAAEPKRRPARRLRGPRKRVLTPRVPVSLGCDTQTGRARPDYLPAG